MNIINNDLLIFYRHKNLLTIENLLTRKLKKIDNIEGFWIDQKKNILLKRKKKVYLLNLTKLQQKSQQQNTENLEVLEKEYLSEIYQVEKDLAGHRLLISKDDYYLIDKAAGLLYYAYQTKSNPFISIFGSDKPKPLKIQQYCLPDKDIEKFLLDENLR